MNKEWMDCGGCGAGQRVTDVFIAVHAPEGYHYQDLQLIDTEHDRPWYPEAVVVSPDDRAVLAKVPLGWLEWGSRTVVVTFATAHQEVLTAARTIAYDNPGCQPAPCALPVVPSPDEELFFEGRVRQPPPLVTAEDVILSRSTAHETSLDEWPFALSFIIRRTEPVVDGRAVIQFGGSSLPQSAYTTVQCTGYAPAVISTMGGDLFHVTARPERTHVEGKALTGRRSRSHRPDEQGHGVQTADAADAACTVTFPAHSPDFPHTTTVAFPFSVDQTGGLQFWSGTTPHAVTSFLPGWVSPENQWFDQQHEAARQ